MSILGAIPNRSGDGGIGSGGGDGASLLLLFLSDS